MQEIVLAFWNGKKITVEPGKRPGTWTVCVEFRRKLVLFGTSNHRFCQDIGDENNPEADQEYRRRAYSIANDYRKGKDPGIKDCWRIGILAW